MQDADKERLSRERPQTEALYKAIGQFIFEFSQLEFMIRHGLGDALGLFDGDEIKFEAIVSPYDFVTSCNVTKATFTRAVHASDEGKPRSAPSWMPASI